MAAQSSEAGPGPEPGGSGPWHHGAELARVTAIDLAVLAGHMLLYPTGILPERVPGPPPSPTGQDGPRDARDARDARGAERAHTGRPGSAAHRPAAPPTGAGARPPVLLLHGFVDNRSAFALLRRSLLRNGWSRVQALNYSPLTTDIRAAAEALGPHVERICEQSGHRRVDIVAHSLGGLVARYYVQRLGGDARVRTLVTLGTPHSGTRAVPALSPHPLARQMRPGSAVLTELAAPAQGCRTRFVAFWSDLDQLMIPVQAARLDHPDLRTRNIRVRGIGHLSLPVHSLVAAEIRHALAGQGPLRDTVDAA
ncbi:esterase/lipase family protein [Actinacidiphila sp. ITFR-21]|uniref:esterase/lipase family protein n=1 Tax=Actinacidiphila sp. ITFR-21 TaxID=3075199 RepID=UPI00288BCC67|nr:alpha/beta fold hydrolase [Streptomyces sp. ITFR-21]WNI17354.1 alpha/beta fold hydrolase [Streptomyces sp. ITFR-21]